MDLAHQFWDLAGKKPDLEERAQVAGGLLVCPGNEPTSNGLEKIKARKRLAEVIEASGKEETEKATSRNDIATAAKISGSEDKVQTSTSILAGFSIVSLMHLETARLVCRR